MAGFTVFKKIKGHFYAYYQKSVREGKTVRSISEYIGSADHVGEVIRTRGGLTLHTADAYKRTMLAEQEAASRWGRGELGQLKPADLLPKFREALRGYTGQKYEALNSALRGYSPMTSQLKVEILKIKAALYDNRAVLSHDVELHRGGMMPVWQMRLGETVRDNAFLSFSVLKDQAHEWLTIAAKTPKGYQRVMWRLLARSGERGYLPLVRITKAAQEHEVLTCGGTFRIIGIQQDGRHFIVTVERVTAQMI